jgi:hypothetical protein
MPIKTKKVVAKKPATAKSAPVMEHKCECGEHCHCHCHGTAHWVKHIIVWALIFALGMACGKMMNCGHGKKHMQKTHPVFVNGCLDTGSIKSPKMQEKLASADVNGDECISIEEYKALKKEMKSANYQGKKAFQNKPGRRGGFAEAIERAKKSK